ncbi:hypothetical protein OMCYN_00589 [cyanobiont of Ornithocercus magnificus]|nr:hypothetical protein OMCYN_00589 [cyanobiont of Ornithocercus magnificus]
MADQFADWHHRYNPSLIACMLETVHLGSSNI